MAFSTKIIERQLTRVRPWLLRCQMSRPPPKTENAAASLREPRRGCVLIYLLRNILRKLCYQIPIKIQTLSRIWIMVCIGRIEMGRYRNTRRFRRAGELKLFRTGLDDSGVVYRLGPLRIHKNNSIEIVPVQMMRKRVNCSGILDKCHFNTNHNRSFRSVIGDQSEGVIHLVRCPV